MGQVSNWCARAAAIGGAWLLAAPGVAVADPTTASADLQP